MGKMLRSILILFLLIAITVNLVSCQSSRRGVRRRRPVTTEPADPNLEDQEGPGDQEGQGDQQGDQIEGEGDQDELQSGRSGSRRLGPKLQRALDEEEKPETRTRGKHGRQAARGRGQQRGHRGQQRGQQRGNRGRPNEAVGLPRRRPNRRPVYYYDYYPEEDYYDEEYYYYYDEDYEEDYDATYDQRPIKRPGNKRPANRIEEVESSSLLDISDPKNSALIQKLWEQYIQEKESTSSRSRAPEVEYECPPLDDVSYYEPDEEQCDKYYECNIKGELKEHLCPDGFTFDIPLQKCDYPVKVNCSTRPLLQEPQPSTNCSRANGFFPLPANVSCQDFWDCREGKAYKQTCPVGVIFDPGLNTCATPDQSTRLECTHGEMNFLNFTCPTYTELSVLKFGNHDRLAHPTDCQQYFSCQRYGAPRLATCPRKRVFNEVTGQCGDPSEVPGCETYWEEKLANEEDDYYYY